MPHPTDRVKTLWDAHHDTGTFQGGVDEEVMDMFVQEPKDLVLGNLELPALGCGSDFTPFLQHLGVRSSTVRIRLPMD